MYKMMIVVQEKENLLSFSKMIQDVFREIEITGVVQSGAESIALIKENEPDILLISIALMPMSGLEIIKRIRSFNKTLHIVALSTYDSIDVLNEVICYGIDGYLLKPLRKRDLVITVSNVLSKLQKEKEKIEKKEEKKRAINQVMELAEYGFIYSILFNPQYAQEIERYRNMLQLENQGYILNVEITAKKEKRNAALYHYMKQYISQYECCILGPRITNRMIIFVNVKEEDISTEEYKKRVYELTKKIKTEFRIYFELEVAIGVGKVYPLDSIHTSYEEAIRALRLEGNNEIAFANEISKNVKRREYIVLEKRMLDSIKYGKGETINLFSDLMELIRPLKYEEKRNKIFELLVLACHAARIEGESEVEYISYSGYCEEIKEITDLEAWAYSKFEYIIKAIRCNGTARKSAVIKDALSYIETHYNEEISLENVASYVGVTPQHFSKIFKDETGYKYVEWITNLRMNMAKKYLNRGDKNIKEICYLIGYKDPNYFSRIFKRVVGVSPTDYIKVER